MRRARIILLSLLFALAVFWVGLMINFPGEAVSRFVSAHVNRFQNFNLVLTPAEFRWNRLYVERAELQRRDNPKADPLFVITSLAIPFTWRLFNGLSAHGVIGEDGMVEIFVPWSEGGESWIEGTVKLEQVPLPKVLHPIAMKGEFRFSGNFDHAIASPWSKQLPNGVIHAELRDGIISGVTVAGALLPPTNIDKIDLSLETGRTINLKKFKVQGDLQGEVKGTITPNLRDPRNSLLSLDTAVSFRNSWLERLGPLKLIVEGVARNGRLQVKLSGTVAKPRLRQINRGSR